MPEPAAVDVVDVPIGAERTEVELDGVVMPGDAVMLGDVDPMVVPPGNVPERPVPLVPVEEKIELPSALVVVLPLVPLGPIVPLEFVIEFVIEVPVLPLRDVGVFKLVPESGVGELMLVEGMVDVTGGLVEVGLDNSPGVDTHGRGSIV